MNYKVITRVKQRILNLLNEKGMSIYELAKQSDVSDACIRNWYSKRDYVPSLTSLDRVCKVLNISLAQLVIEEDEEFYPVQSRLIDIIQKLNALTPTQLNAVIIHINSYLKK